MLPRSGAKNGEAGALSDDLELGDGVGALEVGRDEERRVALVLEPLAEPARRTSSCPSLEAGQMMTVAACLAKLVRSCPGEDRDELLLHDLDDLLGRGSGR